jgi:F-type H+-transporting ATPase subunit b
VSASWVTFLFEAANFLLLAGVLGWLFFRPVRDALERRRSQIESEQNEATQARAEAEQVLEQTRVQRAELEISLDELRERLQREAESERERILAAARAQTQREHEALKDDLVTLRRAQARTLARDAAFAAREIVIRLLETMDGPELEATLIGAARRELEKLRASGGRLAPLVVEAARPLEPGVLARLTEAAGVAPVDASQREDPELIAGLRVLTGSGLIDVSAIGLAAQVERVLIERLEHESTDHD